MKIILLEDVYKQGVAGDMVEVKPGFARNYLIPQGLAVKATAGALRELAHLSAQADVRRAEREKRYGAIAEKLQELTLYFGVKASDRGQLYGSVTMQHVSEALNEEMGIEIDRRRIGDKPLRELGEHAVAVRLEADLSPSIRVVVHREGEDPQVTLAEMEVLEEEMAEAEATADAEALAEEGEVAEGEAAAEVEFDDDALEGYDDGYVEPVGGEESSEDEYDDNEEDV